MPRSWLCRALVAVAGIVLLAGCRLDVNVAVDIGADGSGTVTVVATADADLMARAPQAVSDLRLEDARAAGWTVTGPEAAGAGTQVTLTKPFSTPQEATAILAELNGPNGPLRAVTLTQTRAFAEVTTEVAGEVRLDGGLGAFADDALVQVAGGVPLAAQAAESGIPLDQALGLTISVTAPGDVTETTGTADGGTVTWMPPLAEGVATALQATAVDEDTAALRAKDIERWTVWALVVWAVIFALIVMIVVLLRGRRRRAGV